MSWSEAELGKLYLEEKKSSREIAKLAKCSEHKVNYWLLRYAIPKRSLSEAIYLKYNPHGDPFALRPITSLDDAKLLGLGLGIYWGEGHKKNKNAIRVGNTDPLLLKHFIRFLIRVFSIKKSKLRFGLQIFSDMSKDKAFRFWLAQLKEFDISPKQFFKVTVTPPRGVGNYREKSKYGVLTVYFGNSKLKRTIDAMLPR